MSEQTGSCRLRSLGNKKDDRKAGALTNSDFLFSVTPEGRIKIYVDQPQILTEEQFNDQYYVVERPCLTYGQRRLRSYKEALSYEKMIGESAQDYKFKIKLSGREEVVSFKQITRTSAVKRIVREFRQHEEVYEFYAGDWLLIKRGKTSGTKKKASQEGLITGTYSDRGSKANLRYVKTLSTTAALPWRRHILIGFCGV